MHKELYFELNPTLFLKLTDQLVSKKRQKACEEETNQWVKNTNLPTTTHQNLQAEKKDLSPPGLPSLYGLQCSLKQGH